MEQEETQTQADVMDKPLPLGFMLIMPVYILGILSVFLFPIAGDWRWVEAWLFVIPFTISMTIGMTIINQRNPRVLRNRMKVRKRGLTAETQSSASSDRWIMPVMGIAFFGALILPAIGHRLDWPKLSLAISVIGVIVLNIGLWIMNLAMLENAHASKILDINPDQALVDTGPYARVRHPLYSGGALMMLALPIALGSLISLLPAFMSALMLVIRIPFEEEMLVKGMDGYTEYKERVRYKLIPGIY